MEAGESVLGEIEKHTHADGKETWELVSKTPLRDSDGNITGLLIIGRDITDLKNVQQLAEHRASQLLTASEIARDTSSGSQDINELLKRMVQLVRERFGFYHASIFLLDPLGQFAVLKESTGEAGEVMKQRGHKLAVGSQSIIGQTTLSGQPVIVNDVSREANYFPNPLLPETRSELGIPLINTGQVIGVLDVQSVNLNAFSDDDVRILQVMGDQLAVAIQNAELFTRTESSLNRHRLLHQITAAAGKSSTIDDAIRSAVETLHLTMSKDQITFWTPTKNATLVVKAYAGLPSLDLAATVLNICEQAVGMAALEKRILRVLETSSGGENQPVIPE
jgi:putative methionine-R-sulfoxide reductase with GAF domain